MEDTTVAETDSPYLTAEEASRIHGLSQPAALCEFLITHNNAIYIKTLCETFLLNNVSGKTFLGLRDADFVSLGMTNVFAKRWLLNAIKSASSPRRCKIRGRKNRVVRSYGVVYAVFYR